MRRRKDDKSRLGSRRQLPLRLSIFWSSRNALLKLLEFTFIFNLYHGYFRHSCGLFEKVLGIGIGQTSQQNGDVRRDDHVHRHLGLGAVKEFWSSPSELFDRRFLSRVTASSIPEAGPAHQRERPHPRSAIFAVVPPSVGITTGCGHNLLKLFWAEIIRGCHIWHFWLFQNLHGICFQ